ncbi:hypothetical protein RDI61_01860 [Pseudomonas plecoglossicida]|uniref:hypothetical protein n=1 Tax=Pseudomonas putida group TaxID=136845 RepID=UPI00240F5567|nr:MULTISPECIES: hypothetical protein [Pseudomonas putida group]MDQ7962798.1 hypothetical protein [Pseudomonas plecoglossicida]WFG05204.1 hypothetical protein P3X84_11450 [Pseudomonas putida]
MSQAKERPILFSGPMVRAILNGQKTVTRREIKPSMRSADSSFELHQQEDESWRPIHTFDESCMDANGTEHPIVCPYGQPGDRLWVREAWLADAQLDSIAPRDLSQGEPILYPADGSVRQTGCAMVSQGRGRPSIHMPRWASRILLEITAVRVELLQDITEEQAEAEGVNFLRHVPDADETLTASQLFECLWSSINGDESWNGNPWVWVVEFKRIEP